MFCRAALNFVPREPAGGAIEAEAVDIDIRDGRTAGLPGWQECGFELVAHRSAVPSWDDEDAVSSVHHAEMEALAQAMTGCDHALVTGHIRRSPEAAARHGDLAPITFVHSDFAAGYDRLVASSYRVPGNPGTTAALARHGLTADDVEGASRMVILQFWRNIGPTKMDLPLAFCDIRTIGIDDARAFTVHDYAGSGIDFEALAVLPPDPPGSAGWYVFPELRDDEVVAFRTYDTELVRDGGVHFTPHSAFRDPDVPLGRPARSSIELRATCLYA